MFIADAIDGYARAAGALLELLDAAIAARRPYEDPLDRPAPRVQRGADGDQALEDGVLVDASTSTAGPVRYARPSSSRTCSVPPGK